MSRKAKFGPCLILMRYVIDHFAGHYRAFDFGIGLYDYKLLVCPDYEPIFDSFIPPSLRGRFAVGAISAVNEAKRFVKSNPALLDIAQSLRSRLQKHSKQLLWFSYFKTAAVSWGFSQVRGCHFSEVPAT